jgi:hypothetical protein
VRLVGLLGLKDAHKPAIYLEETFRGKPRRIHSGACYVSAVLSVSHRFPVLSDKLFTVLTSDCGICWYHVLKEPRAVDRLSRHRPATPTPGWRAQFRPARHCCLAGRFGRCWELDIARVAGAHRGAPEWGTGMWWFTLGTMLMISLAVYTYTAGQVYTFSPFIMHRTAATAEEMRANPQALTRLSAEWVRLWPGETVAVMPFDVPVPADGSLTSMPRTRQPDRAELQVPQGLPTLLAFYRTELEAQGWQEVRTLMARPAGPGSGPGNAVAVFCRDAEGPALMIAIVHDPATGSTLHLRLSGEQPGPCASAAAPTPGDSPAPRDAPSNRDRMFPPPL